MSPSNDELSQGARANAAGQAYEQSLEPFFTGYGYDVMTWCQWRDKGFQPGKEGKLAIKRAPFHSIYDHDGNTEWLLINDNRDVKVRIEVKTQRGNGSVDEKIPYMYLNAALCYPEDEVILLVEGDGFKPGMRPWLLNAIDTRWMIPEGSKKHIQMMRLGEFIPYFIAHLS